MIFILMAPSTRTWKIHELFLAQQRAGQLVTSDFVTLLPMYSYFFIVSSYSFSIWHQKEEKGADFKKGSSQISYLPKG